MSVTVCLKSIMSLKAQWKGKLTEKNEQRNAPESLLECQGSIPIQTLVYVCEGGGGGDSVTVRLEEEAGSHNDKLSQPLQSVLRLRVFIVTEAGMPLLQPFSFHQ